MRHRFCDVQCMVFDLSIAVDDGHERHVFKGIDPVIYKPGKVGIAQFLGELGNGLALRFSTGEDVALIALEARGDQINVLRDFVVQFGEALRFTVWQREFILHQS